MIQTCIFDEVLLNTFTLLQIPFQQSHGRGLILLVTGCNAVRISRKCLVPNHHKRFSSIEAVKDAVLMSVELRHAVKDLKQFVYDYNFLREADIHTLPQLDRYIESTQTKISELEHERSLIRNKARRETDHRACG